ncbi:DUF421 domain-containing protein [Treponema sp. R6D11]
MGKRQIGELQPSELVITIMISELAALPASNPGTPLLMGVVPVITLIIAEIFISYIAMRSKGFRRILQGKPSVIIKNGKINYAEMEKIRMNIDDLIEELRLLDVDKIKKVKQAVVETNGKLSVKK